MIGSHSDFAEDDDRNLGAALAGAFAEGIDFGPRGPRIRVLGSKLEAMIGAFRLQLARLGAEDRLRFENLDLDCLADVARSARAYGTG